MVLCGVRHRDSVRCDAICGTDAMRCAVLRERMGATALHRPDRLRVGRMLSYLPTRCYAMSGTDILYRAISLRVLCGVQY
eukprot:942808-Rhodomonas_salina.4